VHDALITLNRQFGERQLVSKASEPFVSASMIFWSPRRSRPLLCGDRTPSRLLFLAGLCAAVLTTVAIGRQTAFRTGAHFVVLDVVVTDERDQPVTNLQAHDFEVRERGTLQRIEHFLPVVVPMHERPVDLAAPALPIEDTATNEAPNASARAIVFVVDEGSLDPADLVPLKRTITALLHRLSPLDTLALTYVGRSDLGQDFTTDVGRFVRSVNHVTSAYGSGATVDLGAPVKTSRGRDLLYVLRNVSAVLSERRESRRIIVLISRGIVIGASRSELEDFFRRSRQANTPVYTLDPSGLLAPELGLDGRLEDQTPERRRSLDRTRLRGQGFLRTVAVGTGGRAFVNRSNLKDAVNELLQDVGAYYVLGYSPSPYTPDGRFHSVSVRVKVPRLRVRSRAGYTSQRRDDDPVAAPELNLVRVLGESAPGGTLPLRAFAAPLAPTPAGFATLVAMDVGYPSERFAAGTGDRLHVAWLGLDSDGRVRASGSRVIDVPAGGGEAAPRRISLHGAVDLPGSVSILRVGLASTQHAAHGTVHLSLAMPRHVESSWTISPLVLGLDPPQRAHVVRRGARAELAPFLPTAQREFAADQTVRVFCRVLGVRDEDIVTTMHLRRNEDIITLPLHSERAGEVANAIDFHSAIDVKALAPGSYVLEIGAGDRSGRTERRAARIQIR
jgi:VWFA-related protein